jgi:hypothetical protein
MPLMTRYEALTDARLALQNYAARFDGRQEVPAEYVREVTRDWDARLRKLASILPSLPVSAAVVSGLRYFMDELAVEDIDTDAEVRWLDAFPSAVASLFPPSAATFRLSDEAAPAIPARARAAAPAAMQPPCEAVAA